MEKKHFDPQNYPLQQETDVIIKIALEIHKILGAGFLEIVYKDAILPHRFFADFVVFGKVIVEIKAKKVELLKKILRNH